MYFCPMDSLLFDLVEHTSRSVFLTGKAGTGKTTFLNALTARTHKKHIIVAPTGIAAINAGGVTIHSLFGLPLRTFLPTMERTPEPYGNNISDLVQHFRYRKDKLKLLRELELLVIDEVSMLRSDVLDMIDHALRHVRRRMDPFGGVQLLLIGDLYQLPPVVREEQILSRYYASPFFFSAKALEHHPLITYELTEVFRQKDPKFLELLNTIRYAKHDEIDFDQLNSRYQEQVPTTKEKYVYLTSHNRMAEEINQRELEKLSGPEVIYKASVVGEFKESMFPNEPTLRLKTGAQIMFIRNDASAEKKYYNGKIAEVLSVGPESIDVLIEGSDEPYALKKEIWENKKYLLDQEKNIKEEVLGSFEQYPIRLAWAVTIHKSQGLTFERVVIDAAKSFVPGQVYVALSRCRTLEGIVLTSPIAPQAILSDARISAFEQKTRANAQVQNIIEEEKHHFTVLRVVHKLDPRWISQELPAWQKAALGAKKLEAQASNDLIRSLEVTVKNLTQVFEKFQRVATSMTQQYSTGTLPWSKVHDKMQGAAEFFYIHVERDIFQSLKSFLAQIKGVHGLKTLSELTRTLTEQVQDYLEELQRVALLDRVLLPERKKLSISVEKIPTHTLTMKLFAQGKSPVEISKERGIMPATVMGHFSKIAEMGLLDMQDLERLITREKIAAFSKLHQNTGHKTLQEFKGMLPPEFEYPEIRLLMNFFLNRDTKS